MKRRVLFVSLVALVVALGYFLQPHVTVEGMIRHEQSLRQWIRSDPVSAWFIGLGVYFLVSLVPGTSGKSVICGWLFGFWQGVLMVDVALTAAALIMFWASRYVLRDAVQQRFNAFLVRLRSHLDREGMFYLLLLRMAHAPFTVVNYVSGVLPISTRTFWWTTQAGLIPGTMVFVFAGTRLPTLRTLQAEGAMRLLDPLLLAALVATAVLPVIARWVLRFWQNGPRTTPLGTS
jgi:uncharacterized membrane protein YdjX (TVP38/TMEM64 family)